MHRTWMGLKTDDLGTISKHGQAHYDGNTGNFTNEAALTLKTDDHWHVHRPTSNTGRRSGSFGARQHICVAGSGGVTQNWSGLSASQCKAKCVAAGVDGCCESRTSGFCRWMPNPSSSQYSSGYTDSSITQCKATTPGSH